MGGQAVWKGLGNVRAPERRPWQSIFSFLFSKIGDPQLTNTFSKCSCIAVVSFPFSISWVLEKDFSDVCLFSVRY